MYFGAQALNRFDASTMTSCVDTSQLTIKGEPGTVKEESVTVSVSREDFLDSLESGLFYIYYMISTL